MDATSGIQRRLPVPHCQSTHTCATHVSRMFAQVPKMATPHERQVVQNLKFQLAHARHDGGAAPIESDYMRRPITANDVPGDHHQPLDGVDRVPD